MRVSELILKLTALHHSLEPNYDYRVILQDSEYGHLCDVEKVEKLESPEHVPYIILIQGNEIPIKETS